MAFIDNNNGNLKGNSKLNSFNIQLSFNHFILSSNFTSKKYSLNDIKYIYPDKFQNYLLLDSKKRIHNNQEFFPSKYKLNTPNLLNIYKKYQNNDEDKDIYDNKIVNTKTKFFTNHNYGYKCSCSKTHCDKYYCECYNSGNYCIDCNCKNCTNQPPKNIFTNKKPNEFISKIKKNKDNCTCLKSGCNKLYCECFKNGNKCKSTCRCIGCENKEKCQINFFYNHKCCHENSIYIINKIIYIDKK